MVYDPIGDRYRLLELHWPWRWTLQVIAASAVMAIPAGWLSAMLPAVDVASRGLARLWILPPLLVIVGVGGAIFLITLRLLGGIDPHDRRQLEHMKLPLKRWLLRVL